MPNHPIKCHQVILRKDKQLKEHSSFDHVIPWGFWKEGEGILQILPAQTSGSCCIVGAVSSGDWGVQLFTTTDWNEFEFHFMTVSATTSLNVDCSAPARGGCWRTQVRSRYGDRHMAELLGITSATICSVIKSGVFLRRVFRLKQVGPPVPEEVASLLAQQRDLRWNDAHSNPLLGQFSTAHGV